MEALGADPRTGKRGCEEEAKCFQVCRHAECPARVKARVRFHHRYQVGSPPGGVPKRLA